MIEKLLNDIVRSGGIREEDVVAKIVDISIENSWGLPLDYDMSLDQILLVLGWISDVTMQITVQETVKQIFGTNPHVRDMEDELTIKIQSYMIPDMGEQAFPGVGNSTGAPTAMPFDDRMWTGINTFYYGQDVDPSYDPALVNVFTQKKYSWYDGLAAVEINSNSELVITMENGTVHTHNTHKFSSFWLVRKDGAPKGEIVLKAITWDGHVHFIQLSSTPDIIDELPEVIEENEYSQYHNIKILAACGSPTHDDGYEVIVGKSIPYNGNKVHDGEWGMIINNRNSAGDDNDVLMTPFLADVPAGREWMRPNDIRYMNPIWEDGVIVGASLVDIHSQLHIILQAGSQELRDMANAHNGMNVEQYSYVVVDGDYIIGTDVSGDFGQAFNIAGTAKGQTMVDAINAQDGGIRSHLLYFKPLTTENSTCLVYVDARNTVVAVDYNGVKKFLDRHDHEDAEPTMLFLGHNDHHGVENKAIARIFVDGVADEAVYLSGVQQHSGDIKFSNYNFDQIGYLPNPESTGTLDADILAGSPMMYYPLTKDTNDASGNGHNLTRTGGSENFFTNIALTNETDGCFSIWKSAGGLWYAPQLDGIKAMECFIRDDFDYSNWSTIFGYNMRYNTSTGSNQWRLNFDSSGKFMVRKGDDTTQVSTNYNRAHFEKVRHVVWQYEEGVGTCVYVDGVKDDSLTIAGNIFLNDDGGYITPGTNWWGTTVENGGYISNFAVYDRVLTQLEMDSRQKYMIKGVPQEDQKPYVVEGVGDFTVFNKLNEKGNLRYARAYDATVGGGSANWNDGAGDTFDGWSGFKLTINAEEKHIVNGNMANDSSGNTTVFNETIGGVPVEVHTRWYDGAFLTISCRYPGAVGNLKFHGNVDGGIMTKIDNFSGHHKSSEPYIFWKVLPLLKSELATFDHTQSGENTSHMTVTADNITDGFTMVFGWAFSTDGDIRDALNGNPVEYSTSESHRLPTYTGFDGAPLVDFSGTISDMNLPNDVDALYILDPSTTGTYTVDDTVGFTNTGATPLYLGCKGIHKGETAKLEKGDALVADYTVSLSNGDVITVDVGGVITTYDATGYAGYVDKVGISAIGEYVCVVIQDAVVHFDKGYDHDHVCVEVPAGGVINVLDVNEYVVSRSDRFFDEAMRGYQTALEQLVVDADAKCFYPFDGVAMDKLNQTSPRQRGVPDFKKVDGETFYVNTSQNEYFYIDQPEVTAFECYAKIHTKGEYTAIVGFNQPTSGSDGRIILLNNPSNQFEIHSNNAAVTTFQSATITADDFDTVRHVLWQYESGSDTTKVYLDGVHVADMDCSGNIFAGLGQYCVFGNYISNGNSGQKGFYVNNCAIYGRALTPYEVQKRVTLKNKMYKMMNARVPQRYWPLDSSESELTAVDNSEFMSVAGVPVYSSDDVVVDDYDKGIHFTGSIDGTNGVTANYLSAVLPRFTKSMEFYALYNGNDDADEVILGVSPTTGAAKRLVYKVLSTRELVVEYDGATYTSDVKFFDLLNYRHFAIVYDEGSNYTKTFINGVHIASLNVIGNTLEQTGRLVSPSCYIEDGVATGGAVRVAHLAVYDRELTAAEINANVAERVITELPVGVGDHGDQLQWVNWEKLQTGNGYQDLPIPYKNEVGRGAPGSGFLFLIWADGGRENGSPWADRNNTEDVNYDKNWKDIPEHMGYSLYKHGTASNQDTGIVYPNVKVPFDMTARYRFYASNGCWSGDRADIKLEFLDKDENVLYYVESKYWSTYYVYFYTGLTSGSKVHRSYNGSYPRPHGYFTFSEDTVFFENISGSNYYNSFSQSGVDVANITHVRCIEARAESNYSGGCTAGVYWKLDPPTE